MNIGKTLFAQVMEFIPWSSFSRIVKRYQGDAGVRSLSPKFDTCGRKRGVLGCVLASRSRKINSLAVLAERFL